MNPDDDVTLGFFDILELSDGGGPVIPPPAVKPSAESVEHTDIFDVSFFDAQDLGLLI